jgi:chromate transporter
MGIATGSRKEFLSMLAKKEQSHPGVWQLLRIWTLIGLQSFGGGSSTILLIQRNFIDKYHWMTMDEFMHFWNLCLLAPGINIIALTILIGKKLAGTRGIIVSLIGMLLPSALITCLITAIFTQIEQIHAVQSVMRGVVPATAGITALVGINNLLPLMRKSSKEGIVYVLISCVLILACAIAIVFAKLMVAVVVLSAVLLGAFFLAPRSTLSASETEQGDQQ